MVRALCMLRVIPACLLMLWSFSALAQTPDVSLSPSTVSWGAVEVGQTSGAKTVTLTNNQTVPLTISSIALPLGADFITPSTTCPASPSTLAANGSCTISVQFRPLAQGSRSTQLTVHDDAPSGTQTVSLSGTATVGPILFSPTSVSFSNVAAGSSSAPQSVTLTNTQSTAVTLTGLTISSQFAQTNNCPVSPNTLAGGATCTLNVTYSPTKNGYASGQLNAAFTSGSTSSSIALYVSGSTPPNFVTLTPATQDFGSEQVGTASAAQSFTLNNTYSSPITISSIATTLSDYATTSTCPVSPATLASNASCTISVTFTPSTTGARKDTLTVTHNAPGSPTTASLTGTGTSGTPLGSVTFTPGSLSWTSTNVGQTSAAQTITVNNNQSSALTISSIALGADFVETATTCPTAPATVAANGSCTVSMAFRPQAQGQRSDTITLTDDGPNSPQSATLSGTGTVGSVLFAPTSLAFANTTVGTQSAAQTATLTNTQSTAVTISSITATGQFSQTNNCPASLAVNASCTVSVTFAPTSTGTLNGTVNVNTGSVYQLYLSGTGSAGSAGSVTLSPSSHSFPTQAPGTQSSAYAFTLANGQSVALNISSIGISTADFTQTNNCGTTLNAGANCTISVVFAPATAGSKSATLTVNDDASGGAQTAALTGTGGSASSGVSLSPKSYTFAQQTVGSTSAPTTVVLTNNQSTALSVSSVQLSAPFAQTNNCTGTVPANGSCTISITYSPTAVGYSNATLSVADNASGSPQTAAISGNAVSPVTTVPKVGGLGFYNQVLKTASTPLQVTVTNNQTTALNFSSITTSADYPFTTNCVGSGGTGRLAAGASCTIQVTFDPQALGSRPATLTIADDAYGSPITMPLTGKGISGDLGPTVAVGPNLPCVLPSSTVQFTADVRELSNTAVNWYVNGVLGGNSTVGTITANGLYTAPSATGTHSIRAVSQANTSIGGGTTVTLTSTPGFAIYPYSASVPVNGQQSFQGQTCSQPDQNTVTYTVDNIAGGNATVGTITSAGLYTAPATPGKHTVRATDAAVNHTSGSVVTVFGNITVDFGSRTNTAHPIPANLFGYGRAESLHSTADANLLTAAGVTTPRLYGQIEAVYATQTPDWTKVDPYLVPLQAAGQHPILQMAHTPTWLQPTSGSCKGNILATPTNLNQYGQILASYVAHLDAKFPGLVQDFEIWNEPNSANLCSSNHLNDYQAIYAAAAPLMKQQAAADGVTIRIGGPVTAGMQTAWVQALLSNSATAPYVDFISYHQYLFGQGNIDVQWDTFDTDTSMYQMTQDPTVGAAATFNRAAGLVKAGNQPLGANTPIYITEFNTNWAFYADCCKNSPTYAPVWNALFVSDLLDSVYSGTQAVPGKLIYFAGNAYPYFCLIGVPDQNMDCLYSAGATPQPYPQYYTYQLLGSPNYLGLVNGGYMAASVTPGAAGAGVVVTAFYTPSQAAVLIVNPTENSYSQIPVTLNNVGLASPQATLYQIVNGQSINSSSLSLTQQGSGYTASIAVGPYSVQAISLK